MRTAIPILLFSVLLVSGCLESVGGKDYIKDYTEDWTRVAVSDPRSECKIGSCHCLVCKNGEPIWGERFNNLVGGSCYMETNCTLQRSMELYDDKKTPEESIRGFMLGQGPSFSEYAKAETYCSYGLGMAVQWLLGNEEAAYQLPDSGRAICLLSKDRIPVYVLYSASEDINATRAFTIGSKLATEGNDIWQGFWSKGPVGPVIVVTEIDFNSSKASEVVEQVRQLDKACENCMIAVAPKINDFESLDAVMSKVSNETDIIAFGVNGEYVDACDNGRINTAKMMAQVRNFTSYALYNHSKPVLIPYVLFDRGTKDKGGCNWTESDVVEAYGAFWPTEIKSLQQRGLIGIAPYSINSTQLGHIGNPLECHDCNLGKNSQRMQAWYGYCQRYTNITSKVAAHPGGGTPIIYPNESGGYCDLNSAQGDYILREIAYGNSGDLLSPKVPELREPMPLAWTCSNCITKNSSPDAEMPFNITGIGDYNKTNPELCTKYNSLIEPWADARSLDPMLVRAFVISESGLDPCSAAKVCSKEYKQQTYNEQGKVDPTCFQTSADQRSYDDECYDRAFDEMKDPTGICNENLTNAPNSDSERPDWRWCATGFAQTLEPPYTFWPAEDRPEGSEGDDYSDIFLRSGFHTQNKITSASLDDAKSCAQETTPEGEFNPFNPTHSMCLGTLRMEEKMQAAYTWINNHKQYLNWDTEKEIEKTDVFAAYVMAHMYGGFWGSDVKNMRSVKKDGEIIYPPCSSGNLLGDCVASTFLYAWSVDKEYCQENDEGALPFECTAVGQPRKDPPRFCFGYTDIVEYFDDCIRPFLPRPVDPGANKLRVYYSLQNCETNMCPEGKRFVEKLCTPDSQGNYDRRMCWAANEPLYPASGTYYLPDKEDDS